MDPDQAAARLTATHPFLITFSGIDGAGKTTQIQHLSSWLEEKGLRVLRLTFWDHIAVWSTMRAGVGHRSADFRRANTMGQKSFAPKNNKHIRKWYLTAARSGLYMLDLARLRRLLSGPRTRDSDVVIFDRYIYDQLANVQSESWATRVYGKLLLRYTPAPDLAFVLDASPTAAFARKPEYPLDFVRQNRKNFLRLKELVPELIVIPDGSEENVKTEISSHIGRAQLSRGTSRAQNTEVPTSDAVVRTRNSCRVQNEPTASV